MKIRQEKITSGEEEIILRYQDLTSEWKDILRYLEGKKTTVIGKKQGKQYLLRPDDIYYFESVDNNLFAYGKDSEYQVEDTLTEIEEKLKMHGFFRCNKSFVINMNRIQSLKSEIGNRIDAKMDNGEHLIVSRRYAKEFRERLQGGNIHE